MRIMVGCESYLGTFISPDITYIWFGKKKNCNCAHANKKILKFYMPRQRDDFWCPDYYNGWIKTLFAILSVSKTMADCFQRKISAKKSIRTTAAGFLLFYLLFFFCNFHCFYFFFFWREFSKDIVALKNRMLRDNNNNDHNANEQRITTNENDI